MYATEEQLKETQEQRKANYLERMKGMGHDVTDEDIDDDGYDHMMAVAKGTIKPKSDPATETNEQKEQKTN